MIGQQKLNCSKEPFLLFLGNEDFLFCWCLKHRGNEISNKNSLVKIMKMVIHEPFYTDNANYQTLTYLHGGYRSSYINIIIQNYKVYCLII